MAEAIPIKERRKNAPGGLEERFWEKVNKRNQEQCWLWASTTNMMGYGTIRINGTFVLAHRVAYALEYEDPEKGHVLHKCDNPPCVNPDHLYLGTPSDNMQDAWDRTRKSVDGEANPNATLTQDEVVEIRKRAENGELHRDLASEFGVVRSTISMATTRRSWQND